MIKNMTYIPANKVNNTSEIRMDTRDRFSPGKTRAWVFHLVFVDSDDIFLLRAEIHTQAQQRHRHTALIQTQQSAHVLIHQTRALRKHRPCITGELQGVNLKHITGRLVLDFIDETWASTFAEEDLGQ